MENDLISYIIPIWQGSSKKEIESSLNSLKKEASLIREIIIVFDGYESFDKEFKVPFIFEKYIVYVYCGSNNGPGVARNKGALFSKSKYIFFLDSGDESVPNRIKIQREILRNNDVSFGNIREIFPSGKEVIRKGASSKVKARRLVPYRNPFNNVTMAIRKKSFLELGGYASLRVAEDWALMGKIIKEDLKISCLNKELVKVYIGNDFLHRRSGNKYFKDIHKCLKLLLNLKLMNRITYLISFGILFLTRRLMPKKILSFLYKILRE